MNRQHKMKVSIAIAVALTFIMPVAAFVNIGTIRAAFNSGNTIDVETIVEATNSDDSYNVGYMEDIIVAEKTIDSLLVADNTIYVDDNADPSWYNETHVKTITEGINNASVGDTVYVYNGVTLLQSEDADWIEVTPGHQCQVVGTVVDEQGQEQKNLVAIQLTQGVALDVTVKDSKGKSFNCNLHAGVLTVRH